MNPARVQFILESTENLRNPSVLSKYKPLGGLEIVDIGCGGGILSQSLARLGANALGIDASAENCKAAENARDRDFSLNNRLNFRCITSDELARDHAEKFDIVCAVEVIEHVSDPALFLESCHLLLKPGGLLIVSTMSRNFISYLTTIALAEDVLQLVPKGTHDFNKYLKVEELENLISGKFQVERLDSLLLNPFNMKWYMIPCDRSRVDKFMANYIISCRKVK